LLRLQQEHGATEQIIQEVTPKQIARVTPIPHPAFEPVVPQLNLNSTPRNPSAQAISVIDLSDEDTVPYNEYFDPYDPVEEPNLEPSPLHNNQEIINRVPPEIINLEPILPDNQSEEIKLEPLDPDAEYQRNIHRMFITLDEYARNIYILALLDCIFIQ